MRRREFIALLGGAAPSVLRATAKNRRIVCHRDAGHAFDRKHPVVAKVWSGICRRKPETATKRQARPLMADDLRALLNALSPEVPAEARDAALLSLGWAAALRRSELIGLDWQKLGDGTGYLQIDDRGLVVTLMASKASQDQAETIIVPCTEMPTACAAIAIGTRCDAASSSGLRAVAIET